MYTKKKKAPKLWGLERIGNVFIYVPTGTELIQRF